ncbi:Striatin family, partial [Snodgrassella alvi SCGC AB-598-O11]
GAIDQIVDRRELKDRIVRLIGLLRSEANADAA